MRISYQALPYANVFLDTSLQVIHVEWEGLVPGHIFRKTLYCVLEVLNTREVYGCIFDLTKMNGIPPQEQDWLVEEILPALSKSKLRKVAFLESHTRLGQLNLNELVYSKFLVILFEFQYFEDVASAMVWLGQPGQAKGQVFAQVRKKMPLAH